MLLRLSSAGQQGCCRAADPALPGALCDMDGAEDFTAEDNGCWIARAAALERPAAGTSGLEECMGEAIEDDCCATVPHALENAVLTVLREIGEDPQREVGQMSCLCYQSRSTHKQHVMCTAEH